MIGWRADIEAVTVEACQAFFDTYYAANNLVLVIVGDIETEETLALVEKEFGGLRRAESIPRNPGKVVRQRGERRARIKVDARIQLVYGAWHAPAVRFFRPVVRVGSIVNWSTKMSRLSMPRAATGLSRRLAFSSLWRELAPVCPSKPWRRPFLRRSI